MRIVKSILYILVSIVFMACLFSIGLWIYFKVNKDSFTTTSGYINSQEYKGEKFYFVELKQYDNYNKNGQACFELNFNGFTDSRFQAKLSTGVQVLGTPNFEPILENSSFGYRWYHYSIANGYEYNTGEDVTTGSFVKLGANNAWIVNLGTEENPYPAALRIKKDYFKHELGWTVWQKNLIRYDTTKLIADIFENIKPLPYGTHIAVVNLAEYFDIYPEITKDNGEKEWSNETTNDVNYVVVQCKVEKSADGIAKTSQSLFGAVKNDTNWSYYESSESYYKDTVTYALTERDFVAVDEGTYTKCVLNQKAIDYLKLFDDTDIIVNLNLDSSYLSNNQLIFTGFGENPFGDLKIKEINITADTATTFEVESTTAYTFNLVNVTLIEGGPKV